jgi:hypothetical protein
LDRVRREQLRRITENPEAFRDKLVRILAELPAAKRQIIAQAFSEVSLEHANDGVGSVGDGPPARG